MTFNTRTLRRFPFLAAIAVGIAMFAIACGGSSPEATGTPTMDDAEPTPASDGGSATDDGAAAAGFDFPTGEPVLVAAGYTHPQDRVDNTGAYLPANGKPTVVFVDAIW